MVLDIFYDKTDRSLNLISFIDILCIEHFKHSNTNHPKLFPEFSFT